MIYKVLCAAGLTLCSSVLEGAKQCSVSVVCLCSVLPLWSASAERRKPCLSLPCRVISEAAEFEIIVAGDCAWLGHLQQMCGSAPQPKDIPFVFHALAVVTGL